ncbi:hypothetical protein [Lewinella sp. IMCC34191]|uniref:hypothetical protein n=1 Tax=Lewinella sp. IMCC34191 TaxID=2259172 RepID=UPI000E248BF4|nr:hypothetical protein [Lewinella sp. IMCC34191]
MRTKIEAGKRYHIYNRGVFRQDIFRDDDDCVRFLNLMKDHLAGPVHPLTYAVLPNHFHLYIEVDSLDILKPFYKEKPLAIGNTIGHLCNAYAKTFRYKYKTIGEGAVFQSPFNRVEVTDAAYRRSLVHYINGNGYHHGLVNDPEDYPFTSLQELLYPAVEPYVKVEKVYADFGGKGAFIKDWESIRRKKGLVANFEWEGM